MKAESSNGGDKLADATDGLTKSLGADRFAAFFVSYLQMQIVNQDHQSGSGQNTPRYFRKSLQVPKKKKKKE